MWCVESVGSGVCCLLGVSVIERGWLGGGGWGVVGALFASLGYGGDICESRGSLELGLRGGSSGPSAALLGVGRRHE